MLKLLVLGPQNVYPPVDGGKDGIYGSLAALAKHASVTYVWPGGTSILERVGYDSINVRPIRLASAPHENISLYCLSTMQMKPFKFNKYSSGAILKNLALELKKDKFDAIICHHAHLYRLAERFRELRNWDVPIVVREHNIEYQLVEMFSSSSTDVKRLIARFFAYLTKLEERRIWKLADAVAFLSDNDYRTARQSGVAGCFVLAREGINLPNLTTKTIPKKDAPLLILFNPHAAQSVVNLRVFLIDWWIYLKKINSIPLESLHVTGVTTEQIANLLNIPLEKVIENKIVGVGFLPSLKTKFEECLGMISPTFLGAGIRKKILEAMAHQVPVIATTFDIGTCIYLKPNVNILEMTDPVSFSARVHRIRVDKEFWFNISSNGRKTVEKYADWNRYAQVMMESVASSIDRRANR